MKKVALWLIASVLLSFVQSSAQVYPETLWVPVTYYDFHSNGSNPEFEQNMYSGVMKGMIQNTLDSDRKPIVTTVTSNINRNDYIKYWFRPWKDSITNDPTHAQGDNTIPLYTNNGDNNFSPFTGTSTVSYDTAFKNVVIHDSLPFLHVRDGVYQYVNSNFFPLDASGFGPEGKGHNFSFTMELHYEFEMKKGLTFNFTGDDDVWCFIDGQLRMDLGGRHGATTDSFSLDNISGLQSGQKYKMDFFFAERHTTESHILITSNIISSPPTKLTLSTDINGSLCAGDTAHLYASVFDADGANKPEFSKKTVWRFIDNGGNASSTLFPQSGDTIKFAPTEAWDSVYIEGTVVIGNGNYLRDTVGVYITACHPDHLVIESAIPTSGSSLRNDNPLSEVLIPSTKVADTVYAVIRDKFGNFINASQGTNWSILSDIHSIIDKVISGDQTKGQGIVSKKGPAGDSGFVTARSTIYSGANFIDTVRVRVDNVTYTNLRIELFNGATHNPITSLVTKIADTSNLIVEGYRADGLGWEPVPGNWSMSSTLHSFTTPPTSSQNWKFCPSDTGHGKITSTYSGLTAQIDVTVNPGNPNHIDLFSSLTTTTPYPNPPVYVDSILAGSSVPIFARVFDANNIRLTSYDNTTAPITWSVREISSMGATPTGSLSGTSGNQTSFLPIHAYNIVQITATFSQSGQVFSDSVRLRILPGAADHITIQADTASIRGWTDVTRIDFGPTDTSKILYPVIRDKYDNYIKLAALASWMSRDTSIVTAKATSSIFSGEGIVIRNTDSTKQAWVLVSSNDRPVLTDSVLVALTNITYDSLRIIAIDNGPKIVDTIKVPTDAHQMLYAQGKRSDGKGWDNIPVKWNTSTGLHVTGTPPSYSDNWDVIPSMVDTGIIFITRTGSVPDTVNAIFLPGLPGKMALYHKVGDPSVSIPYSVPPRVDTLTAGTKNTIVAKIFDRNDVWLSSYENSSISKNLISWQITRLSGQGVSDTLDSKNGHLITFSPKHAYNTYQVTAQFSENGKVLTTSVNFYIKAGDPYRLVIEGSPNPTGEFLNKSNPLDTIFFGSKDTTKYAFAVVRDSNENYVYPSSSTEWTSSNSSIIRANEDIASLGQGRLLRLAPDGTVKISATNRDNRLLTDDVMVSITSFYYDSLRIVINNSTRIDSLRMQLGNDTLLQVQGKRSYDNAWVSVDANWFFVAPNQQANTPSQSTWDFTPADTGKGIIFVNRGSSVPDTISVTIIPGNAHSLSIYNKEGSVSDPSVVPYPDRFTPIIVAADTVLPLVAKIFDQNRIWLKEYETNPGKSALIKWRIEDIGFNDTLAAKLSDYAGFKTSFIPNEAPRSVYVIATIQIDDARIFSDTVQIQIVPGKPASLVIEGSPNWQANPYDPAPIDTIKIQDSVSNGRAYAILRDIKGNFVKYSTITSWGVVNNDTIITVQNGNANVGEGVVDRKAKSGITSIWAADQNGLRDSAFVQLLAYYYKQLRIVVGTDTNATNLVMTTNDDTLIYVQALRSDTAVWENINNARWINSHSLDSVIHNPGIAHSWLLSPTDTAHGQIKVLMDNDIRTKPDSISVQFTVGPPTAIKINILTPPEQRIAGHPIEYDVTLYNKDGIFKGDTCFNKTVKYTDVIYGTNRNTPFIINEGQDTIFLPQPGSECFKSGVDTAKLTLFYAPYDHDSTHIITVSIGKLSTSTDPFILYPDTLNTIQLDSNNVQIKNPLTMDYHDDPLLISAIGFDKWGNKRGPEICNWSTDSTLHPIQNPLNTTRIVYSSSEVTDNEYGTMKATSVKYPTVQGKLTVIIKGPLNGLKAAITRDMDGDGYLDGIDLKFNKSVVIPNNYMLSNYSILYQGYSFTIDTITKGPNDSIIHLVLKEIDTTGAPQTAWIPQISFSSDSTLQLDAVTNLDCTDGAGPVIVKVQKVIKNLEDRTTDEITIQFSEPILDTAGNQLSSADKPSKMFYVWEKLDNGTFKIIDSILIGIDHLKSASSTSITFTADNGNDISSKYYVSFNSDAPYVFDITTNKNVPVPGNKKVKVLVTGPIPNKITPVPNPSTPTFKHTGPGEFVAEHNPNARKWVATENAGTIFTFPITLPSDKNIMIRCRIKIYDLVGNKVIENEQPDILREVRNTMDFSSTKADSTKTLDSPNIMNIDIYWNGSNKKGMTVAPGVYKVIAYLEYYSINGTVNIPAELKGMKRLTGMLGISRN